MTPETRSKRTAVRRHLLANGYKRIDTNTYRKDVHTVDLDAAEMRDGRLRPQWALIWDDIAPRGAKKPDLVVEQGEAVRPLGSRDGE